MNEDRLKLIGKAVTPVSVSVSVTTQQLHVQQQQQQPLGLMITTRLTPFSIDNILGRSRDHAPASHEPISSQDGYSNDTGPTRVVIATSRAHFHQGATPTQELMTSSNLDELQTLLNSKLRHQQQTAPPRAPVAPAPTAPIAPHHFHTHHHQSSHSHLSQQPSTAVVPVSSLYTQFHRHLGILPSSIDGMDVIYSVTITIIYN